MIGEFDRDVTYVELWAGDNFPIPDSDEWFLVALDQNNEIVDIDYSPGSSDGLQYTRLIVYSALGNILISSVLLWSTSSI